MSIVVRKRATKMTKAEKDRYKNVIQQLIQDGTYGQLVSHHADMSHNMHSSMGGVARQRFLGWHRVYLKKLEDAMRNIDSASFIPYWDWTKQRKVPPWLANFMPNVTNLTPPPPNQNVTSVNVTRNIGPPPTLPTKSNIQSVLSESTYTDFTTQLEAFHGDVHVWVGGTMADIFFSPADPLFWLHHANIDRLWHQWQKKASNAGKNPSLSGNNRIFDPWTETIDDVLDISDLGYSYGP